MVRIGEGWQQFQTLVICIYLIWNVGVYILYLLASQVLLNIIVSKGADYQER